jgi:DNA replication and repair protein RecF
MRLTHLGLTNFRNYARLELELPAGAVLLVGENAQGKTNLLEAVYLLATTRSLRASAETELIRHDGPEAAIDGARVVGAAQRADGRVQVEVTVARREGGNGGGHHAAKRMRVNGVAHRAADVVGRIMAVLFTSLDIDLVTGPPAGRRRYLDVTLAQVDHAYLRALQRYTRVLQQRNSLLRAIDAGRAASDQLALWDRELVEAGALIVVTRAAAVAAIEAGAMPVHERLSDARERLTIRYEPRLGEPLDGEGAIGDVERVALHLHDALKRRREREVAAGQTLIGPHRDDLAFALDGRPAASFGSRAQQRTVALALRLSEAAFLERESGEAPVLLLDDILSELDERRRTAVLAAVAGAEQTLITTADADRFPAGFVRAATVFEVNAGAVQRLTTDG